jgi:hypothetical protein
MFVDATVFEISGCAFSAPVFLAWFKVGLQVHRQLAVDLAVGKY